MSLEAVDDFNDDRRSPDTVDVSDDGTLSLVGNETEELPLIQPRLNILKIIMYPTGAVLIVCSAGPSFMSSWVEAEVRGITQGKSIFLGVVNSLGKQALLAVFFFPNIKGIAETLSRRGQTFTPKEVGGVVVMYIVGVPSSLTFALYNLATFDDFSQKVLNYNSTVTNTTLSPVLTDLAHWVQTPAPRVLSAFSAALVNFLSNPGVIALCYVQLSLLREEYKALPEKSQPEKIKFWLKTLATIPAVGVSEWGIVPYIFISKQFCVTYFHFPEALGYTWGAAQLAFMTLLVIDTAYMLSRDGIKMLIEMWRKEFEYPSKAQIVINVSKSVVTLGVVIPGTLHMIWANGYAGITDVATDVATGVASTFFEVFGIYTGLTLLEAGAKWIGNKAAEAYRRKYPAEEDNAPRPQKQSWRSWCGQKLPLFSSCCGGNRGKVQQQHDIPVVSSSSEVSMEFRQ